MTFGELYYCSDKNCHFNLYTYDSDGKPCLMWTSIGKDASSCDDSLLKGSFFERDVSKFKVSPLNATMCLIEVYLRTYEE